MRAMQPIVHELFPGHAFALRDLGFVMREDVVHSAAMNVDLVAEQCSCHRAALDVPARPSWSPRRIPFHVAVVFVPRFPQREVSNVFLVVLVMLYPTGGLQF